jgi:hypothetical protein
MFGSHGPQSGYERTGSESASRRKEPPTVLASLVDAIVSLITSILGLVIGLIIVLILLLVLII